MANAVRTGVYRLDFKHIAPYRGIQELIQYI